MIRPSHARTEAKRPAPPWLAAPVCLVLMACGGRASAGGAGQPDSALAAGIAGTGLEAVAAARSDSALTVAYENRRYRHPSIALGHVARVARGEAKATPRVWAIERRLGLPVAAFRLGAGEEPESVVYPGERGFPATPAGGRMASTERSLDLVLRPLVSYELGRIFDPVLLRFELAPEVRINPWPGARARASLVIPVRNDFSVDVVHPDINRVRPGVSTLEQFGWLGEAILASASGGIFDDNRYGLSAGIVRPMAGGVLLLDAQADVTGHLAFEESGVTYSTLGRWTGFAGVSVRPALLPASLRVRAERYLYGDRGLEVQVSRELGDLDLAFYVQRIEGNSVGGVRLAVPIPPMVRQVGSPVRAEVVDRFAVEYRDQVGVEGTSISGVASREGLLRSLDPGSLRANCRRYRRAAGEPDDEPSLEPPMSVSLSGMTGMINTPWCGVARDGDIEVGFNSLSKKGSYDHRGENRNDVYYGSIGFLPHLEVGVRWSPTPN